jgi:hypothetical protein
VLHGRMGNDADDADGAGLRFGTCSPALCLPMGDALDKMSASPTREMIHNNNTWPSIASPRSRTGSAGPRGSGPFRRCRKTHAALGRVRRPRRSICRACDNDRVTTERTRKHARTHARTWLRTLAETSAPRAGAPAGGQRLRMAARRIRGADGPARRRRSRRTRKLAAATGPSRRPRRASRP